MTSTVVATKPRVAADHVEFQDEDALKHDATMNAALNGQAVSGYELLTPWQTVKAFKLCTLICFAAAFSAATDGYQIGSVTENCFPNFSSRNYILTLRNF